MSKKVLIHSPNWLGDTLMAMPSVRLFAEENPDTEIHIVTKKSVKSLWNYTPFKVTIHDLEPELSGMLKTAKELKSHLFTHAYLYPRTFRSAMTAWLAKIPNRRGYVKDFRKVLLTEPLIRKDSYQKIHQCEEYSNVVGFDPFSVELPNAGLKAPEVELDNEIQTLLEEGAVALMPGSKRGPSKQWPIERYSELGQNLISSGVTKNVIILGDPSEKELCERLKSLIGEGAHNLAGKTSFPQWLAIVAKTKVVVCNDSGGMHISAAIGTPLVAIFGITNPEKTGPRGDKCVVLQKSEIRKRAVPRESVEATTALCRIAVQEVFDNVKELYS